MKFSEVIPHSHKQNLSYFYIDCKIFILFSNATNNQLASKTDWIVDIVICFG